MNTGMVNRALDATVNRSINDSERLRRALLSLEGLSLGDAFGERFFGLEAAGRFEWAVEQRIAPDGEWRWTDDTAMGISIVETLAEHGHISQNPLAARFASRYNADPCRGYGGMAREILGAIHAGADWREVSRGVFEGEGSMGNGGAMRAGPIGAYFSDDVDVAAEEARFAAEVTHAHSEGQAGAVAVAVAAAQVVRAKRNRASRFGRYALEAAIEFTPDTETRRGLVKALKLPFDAPIDAAVQVLGNGSKVIAPDTVPLALWCASRHLENFEDAMWTTVSARGDRDTTCAIVGSIVALAVGNDGLPGAWLRHREPLTTNIES